jgi:hypothetical protein
MGGTLETRDKRVKLQMGYTLQVKKRETKRRIIIPGFNLHTVESAPAESRKYLEGAQKKVGFLPNLLGIFAESPPTLNGYLSQITYFESQTDFDATQRQVILMTARMFWDRVKRRSMMGTGLPAPFIAEKEAMDISQEDNVPVPEQRQMTGM